MGSTLELLRRSGAGVANSASVEIAIARLESAPNGEDIHETLAARHVPFLKQIMALYGIRQRKQRHTYACLLAQAGADHPTISKLFGHADTRIMSRHYAHLCDRTLAIAVNLFLPSFAQARKNNGRR